MIAVADKQRTSSSEVHAGIHARRCKHADPMKYGKEWERETLRMAPPLAIACLNFKAWKKRLKQQGSRTSDFAPDLLSDVSRANDAFCLMADTIIHRRRQRHSPSGHRLTPRSQPSTSSCRPWRVCLQRPPLPDDACAEARQAREVREIAEAASFAALNRRCLYKLCKRMDRCRRSGPRLTIDGLVEVHDTWMAWLTHVRQRYTYDFLGGALVACLDVLVARTADPPPECPICFAPLSDGPDVPLAVVTRCGHCFCGECVFTALGVMGRRGNLRNLAAWANAKNPACGTCPLCRCRDGLLDITLV